MTLFQPGWRLLVVILVLIIALPAVALLSIVDNWSRDLWTNQASTQTPNGKTPGPLTWDQSLPQTQQRITRAIQRLKGWQVQGDWNSNQLRATRTTAWLGFVDDITIRCLPVTENGEPAQEATEHTLIHATSQSRVGKGDLGQNPRNIQELWKAIQND